jgi:hypothetical protein
MRYQASKIVS